MGSRREQGYIPSSAPPTSLGGTSLVGETVLGFPPQPLTGPAAGQWVQVHYLDLASPGRLPPLKAPSHGLEV